MLCRLVCISHSNHFWARLSAPALLLAVTKSPSLGLSRRGLLLVAEIHRLSGESPEDWGSILMGILVGDTLTKRLHVRNRHDTRVDHSGIGGFYAFLGRKLVGLVGCVR